MAVSNVRFIHEELLSCCHKSVFDLRLIRKKGVKFWCPSVAAVHDLITPPMVVTITYDSIILANGRPRRARIVASRPDVTIEQFHANK